MTPGKPRVAALIKPYKAGRLVNQIKKLAEDISSRLRVERSPDPTDDFLLALSEAGKADDLVTGEKGGLLALDRHKTTRIVSPNEFAALFSRFPGGRAISRSPGIQHSASYRK